MEKIYGVDLSKKITPVMARDAIVICFNQAHQEVLDSMDEYAGWESDKEREEVRNLMIGLTVKNAFTEANVDYNNPKKEDFIKVLDNLAKVASLFRNPDIVKKHYNEVKRIIDKIE